MVAFNIIAKFTLTVNDWKF